MLAYLNPEPILLLIELPIMERVMLVKAFSSKQLLKYKPPGSGTNLDFFPAMNPWNDRNSSF
jgi:hypothetical protein